MIIVTGGAGFIGSNLVRGLNARGERDLLVVDNLSDGTKYRNLVGCELLDYMDKEELLPALESGAIAGSNIRAVFHQGACSVTTEWDGRYMMRNNYDYSKRLYRFCQTYRIPFIYASSGAVYGTGTEFAERVENEAPLNVYGYSKQLFDQYVRRYAGSSASQVAGLRYFNVYGPRESHKGGMASVIFHFNNQLQSGDRIKLFAGSDGYADGEQRRDFIHVDDIVAVNLWLLDHPEHSGIFNVGTGVARSFNDVARAVLSAYGRGEIEYIPFPDKLVGRYQSFTEADMSGLRAIGYEAEFIPIERGVPAYLDWLRQPNAF